jgi:hypothetical protein
MDHRAGQAGDDGDRRRTHGERPLALRVEQALRREARLRLLETEGQVAEARRLDRGDIALVDALRVEDVDPAVHDHPHP